MANVTTEHLKTALQSVLASTTRYKPNLSVTDPDDPALWRGWRIWFVEKNWATS